MKSEKVTLAKIEERKYYLDQIMKIITHPVTMAVAGYYLSDRLQGAYVTDVTSFQPGTHALTGNKKWDPNAGKLNQGAAVAMQLGMTAYLGSEAVKTIAEAVK